MTAFRLDDPTTKTYFSAYPRSDDADSLLKSAVFIGAIVGQCVMGLVGDLLGSLEIAMVLTNVLTVVGVVGWYVFCEHSITKNFMLHVYLH